MKSLQHQNLTLRYLDEGAGSITLFFIHGMYNDHTYWQQQIAFFKERYRVMAVDLAGHGESGREREEWSITGLAEDVVQIWKEEQLTNMIVIGHSAGAEVALSAITQRPGAVLGFVAIDNFKDAGQPLPDEYQEQATQILESNRTNPADSGEQYVRKVLVTEQTPTRVTDRVVSAFRNAYAPMTGPMLQEAFDAWQLERDLLPKLDKKLHLINVDYMPTNEEPLKTLLNAGYSLQHMAGTSHYPMLESPDELNRQLDIAIEHIEDEADFILGDVPSPS